MKVADEQQVDDNSIIRKIF